MARNRTIRDNYDLPFLSSLHDDIIRDKQLSQVYYANSFLNRVQQMFKWGGLPDTIPVRFLENYLIRTGNACITLYDGGKAIDGKEIPSGLYAFSGSFGGYQDAYYFPISYIVNNPYLRFNRELTIDENCVIIANDSYYFGLWSLISRYAQILTELDITALNLGINIRNPYGIVARDDTEKKSAEQFLKRVEEGKQAVLAENLVFEGIKNLDLSSGQNNIITQLIELRQYYIGSFYNEIGINANYNMKREAINASETDLNRDALFPYIDDMLEQRKIACKAINAMYGINITVDLNSAWKDEQEEQDAALDALKEGVENADIGTDERGTDELKERVSTD